MHGDSSFDEREDAVSAEIVEDKGEQVGGFVGDGDGSGVGLAEVGVGGGEEDAGEH